jgi:hypothetical protein
VQAYNRAERPKDAITVLQAGRNDYRMTNRSRKPCTSSARVDYSEIDTPLLLNSKGAIKMYDFLLKLGLTVAFLFIFVLILALIFRNRKTGHCGLYGEQKKFGCLRGDCPKKIGYLFRVYFIFLPDEFKNRIVYYSSTPLHHILQLPHRTAFSKFRPIGIISMFSST